MKKQKLKDNPRKSVAIVCRTEMRLVANYVNHLCHFFRKVIENILAEKFLGKKWKRHSSSHKNMEVNEDGSVGGMELVG